VPLLQILAFLYVLVALRLRLRVWGHSAVFRALAALRPWAMAEVFVLAALVAMVKLAAQAEVSPRVALGAYGLLMFTLTALNAITPVEQFWRWIERSSG
jgi:paraquat-inducible protein A